MSPRWRLILAAAAFIAWISWIGYAAVTKSHAPIVSHAQAAAAEVAVVAQIGDELGNTATVVEVVFGENAPQGEITVTNLSRAEGFQRAGTYLLYLQRDGIRWELVGPQRSPGNNPSSTAPLIYRWTDDVRVQAEKLRR